MNKDKIIKDLKERNNKLKTQYDLKEIRCCHLEYENKEQQKRIENLNDILNELEIRYKERVNLTKNYIKVFGEEGIRMLTRFTVYEEILNELKELRK